MTTIDPGEGFRLLGAGEEIRGGDEYWFSSEWRPAMHSIGRGVTNQLCDVWRRRIEPVDNTGVEVHIGGPFVAIEVHRAALAEIDRLKAKLDAAKRWWAEESERLKAELDAIKQPEPEPEWFDLTPFGEHVLRPCVDHSLCSDQSDYWYTGVKWPEGSTISKAKTWPSGWCRFRCLLKDAPPELVAKAKPVESLIPSRDENPSGLHQKYIVTRADGKPSDPNAVYFVLRLDGDHPHNAACRAAAIKWSDAIDDSCNELKPVADDLRRLVARLTLLSPPAESVYGFCPICGAPGVTRERRLNGNDRCSNGHEYPSKDALPQQPKQSTEPAESPDDWVTQDRVPIRTGDQFRWIDVYTNLPCTDALGEWGAVGDRTRNIRHGFVDSKKYRLEVRCRRKDLPPLPQQPKTETVVFYEVISASQNNRYLHFVEKPEQGVHIPTGRTETREVAR